MKPLIACSMGSRVTSMMLERIIVDLQDVEGWNYWTNILQNLDEPNLDTSR